MSCALPSIAAWAIAIRIVDYEFMRTQASPAGGDEAGD